MRPFISVLPSLITVHCGGSNGSSPPSSDSGIQVTAIVWIHHLQVLGFNLGTRNGKKSGEGFLALNCLGLELNQVIFAYTPLARPQSNSSTWLEGDGEIVFLCARKSSCVNTGEYWQLLQEMELVNSTCFVSMSLLSKVNHW